MIFAIDVVGRWVCGVGRSLSVSLPQVMLLVLLLDDYGPVTMLVGTRRVVREGLNTWW